MIREANKNDLDEILQLYYKRATMEDIDELVRTRIIVLRAAIDEYKILYGHY